LLVGDIDQTTVAGQAGQLNANKVNWLGVGVGEGQRNVDVGVFVGVDSVGVGLGRIVLRNNDEVDSLGNRVGASVETSVFEGSEGVVVITVGGGVGVDRGDILEKTRGVGNQGRNGGNGGTTRTTKGKGAAAAATAG